MRTLVALPAAAVDAREAGEAELRLIVLQGLVSHHARARGPGALPSGAHEAPSWSCGRKQRSVRLGRAGASVPTQQVSLYLGQGGSASAQSPGGPLSHLESEAHPWQSPATHP